MVIGFTKMCIAQHRATHVTSIPSKLRKGTQVYQQKAWQVPSIFVYPIRTTDQKAQEI